MRYLQLRPLREKLYFTLTELAGLLDIQQASARVLASRYAKRGLFVRLKNNFYCLEEKWRGLTREEYLLIANMLQVPSYVSFMTALWLYEATTQVPRNFFESASLKRSRRFPIRDAAFNYYKLKKELYFDFVRKDKVFIATKEKAFLDAVYLYSFGKYRIDTSALDLTKLDKKRIRRLVKAFPEKTQTIAKRLCKI